MKVLERCTHNKIVAITVWRGASNVEVSELESDEATWRHPDVPRAVGASQ